MVIINGLKNMTKLLSVIIPLYNSENYIEDCIASIYNQSMYVDDFDVILINDGSTDNSYQVARSLQSQYSNLIVINQENAGVSATRNRGIKISDAHYICFMDADDFWIPGRFTPIYEYIRTIISSNKRELPDLITYQIERGKEEYNDFLINPTLPPKSAIREYYGGDEYIELNNYNNGPWWYCAKKDFLIQNHLAFEEGRLCEDGMFTMKALLCGKLIAQVLGGACYYYVARPNSITSSKDIKLREKLIDDFIYSIRYFIHLIDSQKDLNSKCLNRLKCRVDSYVFSLLVRLIKAGDAKRSREVIKDLQNLGVYPLRYYGAPDYPGVKLKLIKAVLNRPCLYLICCKIMNLRNQKKF